MNDRFKFRFWNKLGKAYENTYDLKCCEHLDYVIPEQCTGLKDRNGKLIYEGDIVKFYLAGEEIIAFVSWDNNEFRFCLCTILSDFELLKREYEVIGNIHENGDLLK